MAKLNAPSSVMCPSVLTWMHYSYEHEHPMAKLNAHSSVTCPFVRTWMHNGEYEWRFYIFPRSMRIWMPIKKFWLLYGDFKWLAWIFGCPIVKLNQLFIYSCKHYNCEIGREKLICTAKIHVSGIKLIWLDHVDYNDII